MLSFSADREDFVNAVNRASQGLASRPVQSIYAGMLFKGENGNIVITASDGDMTFSVNMEADVNSAGTVLLPGRMVSEISRYFAGKTVSVAYDENAADASAQITAGRSHFSLFAEMGLKYPKWEDCPTPIGLLDGEEFANAVRKVIPAASKTDPVLRGVHLAMIDGKLYLVATDHARMAVMSPEFTIPQSFNDDREVNGDYPPPTTLVSTAVLERFARASADHDGTMTLGWNGKVIGMGIPGLQVTSRLISGKFPPDWKKIADSAPDAWVSFDPPELTRIVKMAALAADEGRIELTFDGNDLNVTASQQGRSFSDYVDTDFGGESVTITLGASVLLDALNGCKGETQISFSAPLKPVYFRSGSFLTMIQPRREV